MEREKLVYIVELPESDSDAGKKGLIIIGDRIPPVEDTTEDTDFADLLQFVNNDDNVDMQLELEKLEEEESTRLPEVPKEVELNKDAPPHASTSSLPIYKPEMCSLETTHESTLQTHLSVQGNCSEGNTFKCDSCDFETLSLDGLRAHTLRHTGVEVRTINCTLCPYKAIHKGVLTRHMLIHKGPDEVRMFKCEECPYESKHKKVLTAHMLIHKTCAEVKMFRCEFCPYMSKRRGNLQQHVLQHKSPSEITMFNCNSCSYLTKYKKTLAVHMLTHRKPSELKMFKCEECQHSTKRKGDLVRHRLVHKNPSEETQDH